jgi:hypothetical protein
MCLTPTHHHKEKAMPQYRVEALEKFVVRTVYNVVAKNRKAAEVLCKMGQVAYDEKSIEEGDEEWIETVSVEEV